MASLIRQRREALESRFGTWPAWSLHDLVDHAAEAHPDRAVVIDDDDALTYSQMRARSRELAAGFLALGVRAGDHVGVLLPNDRQHVAVRVALSRVGATTVSLNYLYRAQELAFVLRDSGCRLLVTASGFRDLDHLAMLDEVAPGWTGGNPRSLPDLRQVVQHGVDHPERTGVPNLDDVAALGRETPPDPAVAARKVPADSVSDILYTSGTTGKPKGIKLTHDNILRAAYASAYCRAFEDGRRMTSALPLYHIFAWTEGLVASMFVGGTLITQRTFTVESTLAAISTHRASDWICVPTMAVAVLDDPAAAETDSSSLRSMMCAAAPAPRWLWDKARATFSLTELVTAYGSTELAGSVTLTQPEDPIERVIHTVGRIKHGGVAGLDGGPLARLKVTDPLTGEDLPEGAVGELRWRGPTVTPGRWSRGDDAAPTEEWLASGDLGRIRDDGYVELVGRSKEVYKSGGELVMPSEVEQLLTQQPGVSQAFVVGVPDERWGEIGWAWIVPEPGATVDVPAVIEACREKLARFKVPKQVEIVTVEQLPQTTTGKVQRHLIVEQIKTSRESSAT